MVLSLVVITRRRVLCLLLLLLLGLRRWHPEGLWWWDHALSSTIRWWNHHVGGRWCASGKSSCHMPAISCNLWWSLNLRRRCTLLHYITQIISLLISIYISLKLLSIHRRSLLLLLLLLLTLSLLLEF